MALIGLIIAWIDGLDLHTLVLFMVVLSFLIGVFCFVSVVSLDHDNEEIRRAIDGILKDKKTSEDEKN